MNQAHTILQAYTQAPWRVQLRWVGTVLMPLFLIGMLIVLYLTVSNETLVAGREVRILQAELADLRTNIADQEAQLAKLNTASAVEARATELGLRPAESTEIVYLMVPGYSGRTTPYLAPPPGPAVASQPGRSPEFSQSLLDWAEQQLAGIDTDALFNTWGQP